MHIGSRFVYFNRLKYKKGINTDLPLIDMRSAMSASGLALHLDE